MKTPKKAAATRTRATKPTQKTAPKRARDAPSKPPLKLALAVPHAAAEQRARELEHAERASSRALSWRTERVRLRDLMPWPRNPRRISDQAGERLASSFEEFGQVELLAIGPNRELYNGHQRLKVLAAKHGPDYEVEARVSSRALTEKEREKLIIYLHKGAAGEFDLELLLKEFDPVELNEWGMPELNVPDVPETEWQGMPDFDGNPRAFARLTVYFDNQADLDRFAALVEQQVTRESTSIWFPARPPVDESAAQWSSEQ